MTLVAGVAERRDQSVVDARRRYCELIDPRIQIVNGI
jgi:hypothetical protein